MGGRKRLAPFRTYAFSMQPELLNTIFAGATLVVIAATAIAATVQLRHLRASNQLMALTTVLEQWRQRDLQECFRFVRFELPAKLQDPEYVASFTPDRLAHPELQMCDYFEQLGSYVRYNLIDKRSLVDSMYGPIVSSYVCVRPLVRELRRTASPALYENFEYLATACLLHQKAYPGGSYPRAVPRFDDVFTGQFFSSLS